MHSLVAIHDVCAGTAAAFVAVVAIAVAFAAAAAA